MRRPCRRAHPSADHGTAEFNLDFTPCPTPMPARGEVSSSPDLMMPAAPERVAPARMPLPAVPPPSSPPPSRLAPMGGEAQGDDFPPLPEEHPDEALLHTLPVRLGIALRALQTESRHLEAWLEQSAARAVNRPCFGSTLNKVEAVQDVLSYLAAAECQLRAARHRLRDLPARGSQPWN